MGAKAWIRTDVGFAVRQCNVVDLSDTGVKITTDAPETVPVVFTFSIATGPSHLGGVDSDGVERVTTLRDLASGSRDHSTGVGTAVRLRLELRVIPAQTIEGPLHLAAGRRD